MNKNKQEQLEANGWKVGTVAEFLGLTPEEEDMVEEQLYNQDSNLLIGIDHVLSFLSSIYHWPYKVAWEVDRWVTNSFRFDCLLWYRYMFHTDHEEYHNRAYFDQLGNFDYYEEKEGYADAWCNFLDDVEARFDWDHPENEFNLLKPTTTHFR
jgi:hypothetical protein